MPKYGYADFTNRTLSQAEVKNVVKYEKSGSQTLIKARLLMFEIVKSSLITEVLRADRKLGAVSGVFLYKRSFF